MKNVVMVLAGAIILLGTGLNTFSQNSVLSEGSWFKISVEETGIHKITYNDLVGWGIDPAQVNPQNIRLYGNGNGMLSESNDEFRFEDLQENAIHVFGEDDGNFDPDDYILFYGEGPTQWNMDSETGLFVHETNLYTTHTCYFLNYDLGEGKRIESQASSTLAENGFSGSFDDYYAHELEEENLIHTGKNWYGEAFDDLVSYDFEIVFPNLNTGNQLSFNSSAVGRSSETSTIDFQVNNENIIQLSFPSVNFPNYNGDFAKDKQETVFFSSTNETLNINISYQQPNDSSIAWLDYFEINARRHTIYDQGQMTIRDKFNSMPGDIIKFKVYTSNTNVNVWNITDPMNINGQEYEIDTDGIFYKTEVGGIEEFIVFDESEYLSADFVGIVENQNLHALQPVDLLIITHEDFLSQAEELAQLHQTSQGISVEIIELQKIYNEFSSGVQDVTAIRDFIKYIYEKQLQPSHMNAMFIGNASFDYQNRIQNNTNYIPIWESLESLNPVSSYCTDDFFGIFDDNNVQLEVGIGRLPVGATEEAENLVEKITHYITNQSTMGNWRNRMAFVADDEDGNLHLEQTEDLIETVNDYNPSMNSQKIFLDAYEQEDTPDGERYPEVNQAISNVVNDGASIICYTGHGSNLGWAYEQVLTESDYSDWVNPDMYPLILAATADFGRSDDPTIISMAKKSILLENAGAISVLAANRATYAGSNKVLLENFYKAILDYPENSVGEAVKLSKQWYNLSPNSKKFSLLGDPALRVAIPFNKILTETINGISIQEFTDTIHPGEQITISGFVTNEDENLLSDFNGTLILKIYDPVKIDSTLGNDESSWPVGFETQDVVVYELETAVVNGQFDFTFNYPNISYEDFGNIKLSYYAFDDLDDAAGKHSGIMVGGQMNATPEYQKELDLIHFYPTVVANELNYRISDKIEKLQISIYDLHGKLLYNLPENNYDKGFAGTINISELKAGMYFVKAISMQGVKSVKLVKQ